MIYFVSNNSQLFESEYYTTLSTSDSLKLISGWNIIQFDTETTGRDAHICDVLCAQFGNKAAGIQIVVDTSTVDLKLYKIVLETIPIIGQNLKFDLQFLFEYEIIPTMVYDTMIVEQLLYLGYPPGSAPGGIGFSLSAIGDRYLGIYIDKSVRGEIIWRGLDDSVIIYAAGDVVHLEDIMEAQWKACNEKNCLVGAQLECSFVPVMAYLEWSGIKLDITKWTAKMDKDKSNMQAGKIKLDQFVIDRQDINFLHIDLQGDLFSGFNTEPVCTINWASSQQVIKYVNMLGFNTSIVDKKTGEDKDSVLEKHLKGQKGINDAFLKIYFEYKEYDKVVTTYGQKYLNAINPNTGRIHTQFRQLGASSGRMACGSKQINTDLARLKGFPINPSNKQFNKTCSYPQLQNLPADEYTRSAFIPEVGNLMCSSDYSALESRLGADIYNDPAMIEEYLHGSGDIHSLVAKACFPTELEGVDVKDVKKLFPKLRSKAKAPEFAKQFGGGAMSIAGSLNCSMDEAQAIADAFDSYFIGISTFAEQALKNVKRLGYVLINPMTGHKVYWWDWSDWNAQSSKFDREYWDRYKSMKQSMSTQDFNNTLIKQEVSHHFKVVSKWGRMGLNSPTQGTGIIILKYAMVLFFRWVIENGLFGKVLLCNLVHDEAVIEYPEDMPIVAEKLKYYMEVASDYFCKKLPIPAESSIGDHWIH